MAEASNLRFPPQKQEKQPGKQYLMNPIPESLHPDYKPANKLQGKVALVTGGDSGIGRAVSYHFALEGATVAFTYVPGQEDRHAADTLRKIRELKTPDADDPIALPTDVGFDDNCRIVVEQVVNKFGRIDILVNNAAEQPYADTIEDIDPAQIERTFRTNIFSHFYMTRYALKHMGDGSSIINTTSIQADKPQPTFLDYCSTKGAMVSFTRGLALQLVKKGIRVNAVAPGAVWTPLQVVAQPIDVITTYGSTAPIGRAAQPYEMAPTYVFLASRDSSYFVGQVLIADGGVVVKVEL